MDTYKTDWTTGSTLNHAAEPASRPGAGQTLPWLLVLVLFIELVEYVAPTGYIFSYLYAIPILISANGLSERQTRWVMALGITSTLLGLFVPHFELNAQTLTNRMIICSALGTVGLLSLRYRKARLEAEEERLKLEGQKQLLCTYENFTAALTHDLKTPLQGIEQTLEFFARGRFGTLNPEQSHVVQLFQRSLGRLLGLTDMLLAIYRNEREPMPLRCERTDLGALAAEAVEARTESAGARQVELVYEGLEGAYVNADGLQLGRALTNLIANAVEYTRLGSRVYVALQGRPAEFWFSVSDCGPGIPEEDLDRIFERFYQSPLTRQSLGTGLGLYLSRQIVEAHGGRIWAANGPTGGCTFVIALPGNG